jgi:hypothetical protein
MNKCVSSITSHPCSGVNPFRPSANFIHGPEIIDVVRNFDSSVFIPGLNIIICDGKAGAAVRDVDGTFVAMCLASLFWVIRLRLLSKTLSKNRKVISL